MASSLNTITGAQVWRRCFNHNRSGYRNEPEPTALHLDFIRASEEEAEARSNAQRKQLELIFAKLFFPNSDPWVETLEAFAIYFVGFVARPVALEKRLGTAS